MKKLLAILLALCMVMSLAACGSDSKDEDKEKDEKKTEAVESGDKKEEESPAKPEKEEEEDATPSPKDPDYVAAFVPYESLLAGDIDALADIFPNAMWDTVAQAYTIELSREVSVDEAKEMLIAETGMKSEDMGDVAEFTVLEEREAPAEAIEAIQTTLKNYYVFSEISEAYELDVSLYVEKDGENKTEEKTVYVVLVDGQWLLTGDNYEINIFN